MKPVLASSPLLALGVVAFTIAPFAGLLWRTREWFAW